MTSIDQDDIIQRLRGLQGQRDRGEISQRQYTAAFDRLNRSVGRPCSRCKQPPAVIRQDDQVLCGPCAARRAENRQIGRRTRALAWALISTILVVVLSVGLALVYVAQLH